MFNKIYHFLRWLAAGLCIFIIVMAVSYNHSQTETVSHLFLGSLVMLGIVLLILCVMTFISFFTDSKK